MTTEMEAVADLDRQLADLDRQLTCLRIPLTDLSTMSRKGRRIKIREIGRKMRLLLAERDALTRKMAMEKLEEERNRYPEYEGKDKVTCDAEKIEIALENHEGKKVEEAEEGKKVEEAEEGKKVEEAEESDPNSDKFKDPLAFDYKSYQQFWNDIYAKFYGSFEDKTNIPRMRFTFKSLPYDATTFKTLDVLSVKIAEIREGLQWPLDIFGVVALRDSVDHNRNVIFNRERDNCLTLTKQDPCLVLTGPMRAAILCDPVILEVRLLVRGPNEPDDKELSLLVTSFWDGTKPRSSYFTTEFYTSRLSTLEFGLGLIVRSVEATISVKVSSGSWPNGFCCQLAAFTDSIKKKILLLDSGAKEVPLTGDDVNLVRCVVSVEINGKLIISGNASDGSVTLLGDVDFKPQEAGTSSKELRIDGFCPLDVTVSWSLFSFLPVSDV